MEFFIVKTIRTKYINQTSNLSGTFAFSQPHKRPVLVSAHAQNYTGSELKKKILLVHNRPD